MIVIDYCRLSSIIGLSIIYIWNHYRARKSYHFLLISECTCARDDCISRLLQCVCDGDFIRR